MKQPALYSVQKFNSDIESGPYTSIGMYPKYFITLDGGILSFKSARENAELIRDSIRDTADVSGWQVIACDVNWESFLYCDHSGEQIESAYEPIEGA
jgi:hypothetical protein